MTSDEMKRRTRRYALAIIRFVEGLPRSRTADVIARQLLRCGTSVGSNYRAACRARSPADFVYKLGIVEEERDESLYWMELLVEAGITDRAGADELLDEGYQILAIIVASIKSSRRSADTADQ